MHFFGSRLQKHSLKRVNWFSWIHSTRMDRQKIEISLLLERSPTWKFFDPMMKFWQCSYFSSHRKTCSLDFIAACVSRRNILLIPSLIYRYFHHESRPFIQESASFWSLLNGHMGTILLQAVSICSHTEIFKILPGWCLRKDEYNIITWKSKQNNFDRSTTLFLLGKKALSQVSNFLEESYKKVTSRKRAYYI